MPSTVSTRLWFALVMLCLVSALSLVGCNDDVEAETGEFHHVMDMGNGRTMTLAGHSGPYTYGAPMELGVGFNNGSDQPWDDAYCLLLVDQNDILALIVERQIGLPAGESVTDIVRTRAPANVAPAAYGLVLLVPGSSALTATILIGEPDPDEDAGPWPSVNECRPGTLPPPSADVERQPGVLPTPQPAT